MRSLLRVKPIVRVLLPLTILVPIVGAAVGMTRLTPPPHRPAAESVLPKTRVLGERIVRGGPKNDGTLTVQFNPPSVAVIGIGGPCKPGGIGHLNADLAITTVTVPSLDVTRVEVRLGAAGPSVAMSQDNAWESAISKQTRLPCPVNAADIDYRVTAYRPDPITGVLVVSGVRALSLPVAYVD